MEIASELKGKIAKLLEQSKGTLYDHLGLQFTKISLNEVAATMPVERRTHQPFGLLHGGASVVLSETLASTGGWINVDGEKYAVVGIEINANHVRSVRSGLVTGTATPVHIGKSTQVWETRIVNKDGRLVCASRCTLAVISIAE